MPNLRVLDVGIYFYMFHNNDTGRAYLWQSEKPVDIEATNKARGYLEEGQSGKLFVGPTGVDEMKPVDTVKRKKANEKSAAEGTQED